MPTIAATALVGDILPSYVVTDIRAESIQIIALLLRDSNPIHFDLDAVRDAGLGDRAVNQGGASMAYIMTMLTQWAGGRSVIKSISCRFRGTVHADDTVECSGTVTHVETTEAGPLVTCQVWADVRGGRRAIEGTATVLAQ
ncbi:MAG TPA: MaoC family dehydratase [Mycobacterium sp.]